MMDPVNIPTKGRPLTDADFDNDAPEIGASDKSYDQEFFDDIDSIGDEGE
jgi:hypothetical protein